MTFHALVKQKRRPRFPPFAVADAPDNSAVRISATNEVTDGHRTASRAAGTGEQAAEAGRQSVTHVDNIFEVIFRRRKLKWDALWNVLHWLCVPGEGHGLDRQFLDRLTRFAFGSPFSCPCETKLEFRIDEGAARGRWPDLALGSPRLSAPDHLLLMDDLDQSRPGDNRKLSNLQSYLTHATKRFPRSQVRLLVVTDGTDRSRFSRLYEQLGAEAKPGELRGWRLLKLRTVGEWVDAIRGDQSLERQTVLRQFVEWTRMLGEAPR